MPCYQINRVQVELKAADFELLREAARSAGLEVERAPGDRLVFRRKGLVVFSVAKGTANVRQTQMEMVNRVKRAYAEKSLEKAGRKFGWAKTSVRGKKALRKGGGW